MKVLIAEDNPEIQFTVQTVLEQAGHTTLLAQSGQETLRLLARAIQEQSPPDLILSDIAMPGMGGFELLEQLRALEGCSHTPFIFLSSKSEIEDIRQGLQLGADDYVLKPFQAQELVLRVESLYQARGKGRARRNKHIIGSSDALGGVFELIDKLSGSLAPVLITGESGTGKELVAKSVHTASTRSLGPFVALNCSAFHEELLASELFGHVKGAFTGALRDKKGLFEIANDGTLFLDELGEMPLSMQAKLLRVLQDGSFTPVGSTEEKTSSARIVAATNRDLPAMVKSGEFREDLLYRIQVVHVHMPALRERVGDIAELARYFIEKFSLRYAPKDLSAEAVRILSAYEWPGNVRELENELERAFIVSGEEPVLRPSHFSKKLFLSQRTDLTETTLAEFTEATSLESIAERYDGKPLAECLAALERVVLMRSLARHRGNKSQVAKELDISRSNLIAKAKAYGFSTPDEES